MVGWSRTARRYASRLSSISSCGSPSLEVGERGLRDLRQRARHLALDDGLEQGLQVPEVLVDDRARDPGALRDGLDRNRLEPASTASCVVDVEQLLAPGGRGHAPAGAGAAGVIAVPMLR